MIMHLAHRPFRFILLLLLGISFVCGAKEYHIDTQSEFDALCTATFQPGDVIRFKRGRRFAGMFAPRGSGTERDPIRIVAYGPGSRPRIDAGGQHVAGVFLLNPAYWEVSGLEITNTDGTDRDQGTLFGIYVLVQGREGVYRHVYIDDCFIHDVNGLVGGKQRGGIHVHVRDCRAARFDDLRITRNRIVRVGGVGIGNATSCGRVEFAKHGTVGHHLWTRVYVVGNQVDTTGRNNIIARACKDAVYEYNLLANSSRAQTGHSIFGFNCDGLRIQHNEAFGNVGEEGHDRGGFDADYNCVNTLIQYNYSHDNEWFCGIMKRRNRHAVIRYNLSQNDRRGIYFYGFEKAREATNIYIYNNTHFVRRGLNVRVFAEDRTPLNTRFENNIFYFAGRGLWGRNARGIHTLFRNNLYFNITPHESDPNPITVDPRFERPGQAPAHIDLRTMQALRGYRLQPGSPAIDAGLLIPANGGRDLLGIKVPTGEKADLGALEWSP